MRPFLTLLVVALMVAPASAALVINELDSDTPAVDTAEYVEIYNTGPGAVDFATTPYVLVFFNGASTNDGSYLAVNLTGTLAANDYLVVGDFGVPNLDIDVCGGVACSDKIQNGPDAVALYTGTTASWPNATAPTTVNMVDALVYDTADADDTALMAALGQSTEYDENQFGNGDTTSISRLPNGSGTFTPGSGLTPGAANASAPPAAFSKYVATFINTPTGTIDLCATGGSAPFTFTITVLPANGVLKDGGTTIAAVPHTMSGALTYTPNTSYSGLDTFTFTATDSQPQTSAATVQEVGVQGNQVVISEVMHTPSGDNRIYEYVEIYNYTGSAVALTRLDAEIGTTKDTTANLSVSIPANSVRIIAPGGQTATSDQEFRCEWGSLLESDIIRIPIANFETLFADPDPTNCGLSRGSRLLLFGAGNVLLDSVDLSLPGAVSGNCTNNSYAVDPLWVPPFDTATNDDPNNWSCTADIPNGRRTGVSGDAGSPGYVPLYHTSPTYGPACYGACCLPNATCIENQSQNGCLVDNCGTQFGLGLNCGDMTCTAVATHKCCLPTGVCANLGECDCLLLNGDWNGSAVCTSPGQSTGECPVEVAVVVNELDYDTPGTDTEEFVELWGTPGASLAGWTIELFNGADTNGTNLYATIDLATTPGGVVPADGFLVIGSALVPNVDLVQWTSGGIQNGGAPKGDGLVLLFGGAVVEGFAYGGTTGFTANGGDANGTVLVDIGVADTSSGSLQKIPNGGVWTLTGNRTPGATNFDGGTAGACCNVADFTCALHTAGDCAALGAGYEFHGVGTACDPNPCIPTGACCLPNGSCVEAQQEAACVDVLGGEWHGADSVCPAVWNAAAAACFTGPVAGVTVGCESWDLNANLHVDLKDFYLYDESVCVADPVGACCLPNGTCQQLSQWECSHLYGAPAYHGNGSTCVSANCQATTPGSIRINEIWAEDPSTDNNEFIELFGTANTNLSAYTLIIVDGDTLGDPTSANYGVVTLAANLFGYALNASGYFVMGTGPQAGPPAANVDLDVTFGNNNGIVDEIQNGSQTYALVPTANIAYCTSNGVPDASCNGNTKQLTAASMAAIAANAIDTVGTRDGVLNHVYFYAPLVQDSGQYVFDYAQRIPNGVDTNVSADWETAFGIEMGTPADPSSAGAANHSQSLIPGACCNGVTCSLVTEAACAGLSGDFIGFGTTCTPNNPCACVTIAQARALAAGQTVTLCNAVVSSTEDMQNATTVKSFQIQDATDGITLYGGNSVIDPLLAVVVPGDQIDIIGVTGTFNGLAELLAPFTLINNDGFVGVPVPASTTVADYQNLSATAEGLESKLVSLECATFTHRLSGATWIALTPGEKFVGVTSYRVTANGGSTYAVVRVSTNFMDLVGLTIPTVPVRLTGIFSQYDASAPFTEEYQLLLRSQSDIEACP
jgi:hypothetical protein